VAVGSAYQSLNFAPIFKNAFGKQDVNFPAKALAPADNLFPLEDGDILLVDSSGSKEDEKEKSTMETNFGFTFNVAFDGGNVAQGLEIVSTLTNITSYIDDVVDSFEGYFA